MNTLFVALLFLVRALVPFTLLIAIGEWVHHREMKYWLRM